MFLCVCLFITIFYQISQANLNPNFNILSKPILGSSGSSVELLFSKAHYKEVIFHFYSYLLYEWEFSCFG